MKRHSQKDIIEAAPRKIEQAPRKIEQAPRKIEQAPQKIEQAPQKYNLNVLIFYTVIVTK